MSTKCSRVSGGITTTYGRWPKPLKNLYGMGVFFVIKIFKKVLDKGEGLWYYSRARPNESEGNGQANLENDTERNAQEIQRRFQRV